MDDARIVGWIVNDGWFCCGALISKSPEKYVERRRWHTNEETLAGGYGISTMGEFVSLLLRILKECLDLVILHGVLDWSEQYTIFIGCANLDVFRKLYHALHELGIDGLVDVYTLRGNAHLARVEEGTHGDFRNSLVHINVRKNDARIISTKLEGDPFEGLCAGLHNLLSGGNGTSEGDLGYARVGCEKRTELVIASENLDDAWGEDLLGEFYEFESRVRSEWAGLDDDGAAYGSQWTRSCREIHVKAYQ